jgi:hypothetical protein
LKAELFTLNIPVYSIPAFDLNVGHAHGVIHADADD